MKPIDYIQLSINLLLIGLMTVILVKSTNLPESPPKNRDVTVELQEPYFFLTETPDYELLKKALIYYEIEYPEIVFAQAILETGHFRSKLCKENNNLFGLYNSKKKEYFKFSHWAESVEAYKNYIQYKYFYGDYYLFLDSIGYASDPQYINKVKNIVKRNYYVFE